MVKEPQKDCLITLYLDTPKPLLRPFKDPFKHCQLESLFVEQSFNPVGVTGHAFVGLTDQNGGEFRFGYTAAEISKIKAIYGTKGEIVPEESESFYNEAIIWKISQEQYNAAKLEMRKQQQNPGQYKLFERNCSTVAMDVLKAAKVEGIPTDKMGLTPYGLVLKKRLMLAQRRAEVLKFKIKNAVKFLFGKKRAPTSELLDSLRSKPIPVPIRVGMKKFRDERKKRYTEAFDINALTAKLAFTKNR